MELVTRSRHGIVVTSGVGRGWPVAGAGWVETAGWLLPPSSPPEIRWPRPKPVEKPLTPPVMSDGSTAFPNLPSPQLMSFVLMGFLIWFIMVLAPEAIAPASRAPVKSALPPENSALPAPPTPGITPSASRPTFHIGAPPIQCPAIAAPANATEPAPRMAEAT